MGGGKEEEVDFFGIIMVANGTRLWNLHSEDSHGVISFQSSVKIKCRSPEVSIGR